jgi:putative FmdB family regulatory protein
MPVYDYRCTECNSTYDIYHKGKEVLEDVKCPACSSKSHIKLMSIPSISVKAEPVKSFGGNLPPGCASGCCGGSCPME